jgi:hypothetical protein
MNARVFASSLVPTRCRGTISNSYQKVASETPITNFNSHYEGQVYWEALYRSLIALLSLRAVEHTGICRTSDAIHHECA